MKLRLTFKINGKEQSIEVPCESHQSPMIPVFCTVIKEDGKLGQAKYININHRGNLKMGADWNK